MVRERFVSFSTSYKLNRITENMIGSGGGVRTIVENKLRGLSSGRSAPSPLSLSFLYYDFCFMV